MKKIFAAIAIVLTLCGCAKDTFAESNDDKMRDSEIIPLYKGISLEVFYLIDNKTGIVYVIDDGYHSGNIIQAYNPDGTIMTKKDLKDDNGY